MEQEKKILNDHIDVQFAENDENGNRSGRVNACSIGEMELEVKYLTGIPFTSFGKEFMGKFVFRIHDKDFKANSYMPYCGNLIWNSYWMPLNEVVELIDAMSKSGDWSIQEAPTIQFEKFQAGEVFTLEDVDSLIS